MTTFGNFKQPQANTFAQNPPAANRRGRYEGIKCADTRDPMLDLGTYRLRVEACTEGFNPGRRRSSHKISVRVIDCTPDSKTPKGATGTVIFFETPAGLGELKRLMLHAAGFGPTLAERAAGGIKERMETAEAQYDALDKAFGYEGAIIESSEGQNNGAPSIVGRIVDCHVTQGKPVMNLQTNTPTNDFYRIYTWGSVPENEQQQG